MFLHNIHKKIHLKTDLKFIDYTQDFLYLHVDSLDFVAKALLSFYLKLPTFIRETEIIIKGLSRN